MASKHDTDEMGIHHRAFAFFVLLVAILIGFAVGYISGQATGEAHAVYLLEMGRTSATTTK